MDRNYTVSHVGHGPYRGDNPRAREAAEIMNELFRRWRLRERVDGLMWILGQREAWAIRQAEPGTHGVEVDRVTGDIALFGLPVYECRRESVRLLVKESALEDR